MTFLVVLSALLINHFWVRERHLPVDAWFDGWQQWLEAREAHLPGPLQGWSGTLPLIGLLLPLIPVAIVLWVSEDRLLGLLSFGLHLLVVVYCMARVNLHHLINDYLDLWRGGNFEAAYMQVREQAPEVYGRQPDDYALMHQKFVDFVLSNSFRRLFGLLFWYIVLGPLVALMYFLLQQMLRSRHLLSDSDSLTVMRHFQAILEWVPARLLALAFALAGDFVVAFNRLRERLADGLGKDESATLLRACALAAIGRPDESLRDGDYTQRAAWELASLRDLLLRAQFVWVMVLAVLILVV
jgi:AmpE protein